MSIASFRATHWTADTALEPADVHHRLGCTIVPKVKGYGGGRLAPGRRMTARHAILHPPAGGDRLQ